jgi:triphosphatase
MSSDHQEVEWQYDTADIDAVEQWLLARPSRDGLTLTANPEQPHHDVYFDTPDLRFVQAGYALRVRRENGAANGAAEVTLKSLTPPGEDGIRRRREVNESVNGTGDPSAALRRARGEVGQRIRAVAGSREVRPLFEVTTRRRQFDLSFDNQRIGVAALDRTSIRAPGASEETSLSRIEVEAGDPLHASALQDFVRDFAQSCDLRDAAMSKFEAGLRAADLQPPAPPDFGPTDVKRKASAAELACAVLRRHFADFLSHELAVRLGDDPDAVHAMRVAARRSRTVLGAFADHLPQQAEPMREELHWLAQTLGPVRDLDVQLARLDSWACDLSPQDCAALAALRDLLSAQRAAAHKRLLAALDSPRYAQWLSTYTQLLNQEPGDAPPARKVLPALIRKRFRKVRCLAEGLNAGSAPADYHTLRIQAKRLRDTLDSVEELYPKSIKAFVKPLGALQNVLGQHQDAQVAMAQLRQLIQSRKLPPATVFVMGEVAGRCEQTAEDLRQQVPAAWRAVQGKPWQRLKRVLARNR